jgi:DNA-binding XRE family transcriptional regulator
MGWGFVETEPEVTAWLDFLTDDDFGQAERYIERGQPMTTTSWNDIEARRTHSAERQHGYDRAGRAIRLATELRALREKKGLSQRQLAELIGTTQSAIARLEGGRISPSLPTLDRIAAALGAEVTVTFTDTELIGAAR